MRNVQLDPNRSRLYDFLTEIGPSSRCRGEAALWRLRMTWFVLQPASGRDATSFFRLRSLSACCRLHSQRFATSDTSMVSRGFPAIVTGYSHSVDVVVRRGLYLLARGGTHSFRYPGRILLQRERK